ncbi:MAG: WecB/TagA/CpsF family glycosyltransferase [Deltaproteobacteria bacterium]|nr:WecB/TagA/CpsF family glycosyltransferase [Deltaproteobacteria bacterium]
MKGHGLQRVNILGVGIRAISLGQAVRELATWIEHGEPHYVNACTVHTVMECRQDPTLKGIVNQSGMAVPDGMPLVWLCRLYGRRHVTRVYGPDLLLAFCGYSEEKGFRHFLYGGTRGVADKLATELRQRFPKLHVSGSYSPPFRKVGEMEEPAVIEHINASNPDVVWVGLGTPKQDFWVAQHRALLKAPVLVAVGAAFDFLTGRVPQAPLWIRRSGLEWLFRLLTEPRRLWYRYLVYNPLFIVLAVLQATGLRRYIEP